MIQIENLSKNYGSKTVLKQINFELEPGKVYGMVGENGAGKTTLFKCIAGLEPCSGSISSPYPILKNHLGFLPTNPYFLPKITGSEYLQLLCNARNIPLSNFVEKNILTIPHEGLFNRDFFYKTVEEIEPKLLEKIRQKLTN